MELEKFYLPAAFAWSAALFVGSVLPSANAFGMAAKAFNYRGIGLHLFGYAVLGLLLILALKRHRIKNYYVSSILIAVLYGILLELIQYFVPARTPSAIDAAANTIGAFITAAVYDFKHGIKRIFKK